MRPKGELPTQPFNPPTPHKVISIHVAFNDCNGFLSQYMYNTIHGIWHILYTSSNAWFFAISSHKCRSPIWTFSTTSSCWSFDYCWSFFLPHYHVDHQQQLKVSTNHASASNYGVFKWKSHCVPVIIIFITSPSHPHLRPTTKQQMFHLNS